MRPVKQEPGYNHSHSWAKGLWEPAADRSAELLEADTSRRRAQIVNTLFRMAAALLYVGCGAIYIISESNRVFLGALITVVVATLLFRLGQWTLNKRFEASCAESAAKQGPESVLCNLKFFPEACIDQNAVEQSQLFPPYDLCSGNDYLSAEYRRLRFVQSSLHLQRKLVEDYQDEHGLWHTCATHITVFQGRLTVFDCKPVFGDPVTVFPKCRGYVPAQPAHTDRDAFHQRFTVEAEDAITACRILTPQVQEAIVSASEKLTVPLSLSFHHNKLYVALANPEDTEEHICTEETLYSRRDRMHQEMLAVLEMADAIHSSF